MTVSNSRIAKRTTSLLAAGALALGLTLVPAAAAHAGSYHVQIIRDTQSQCLYEQNQWRHGGDTISRPCYYAAGKWMFMVLISSW